MKGKVATQKMAVRGRLCTKLVFLLNVGKFLHSCERRLLLVHSQEKEEAEEREKEEERRRSIRRFFV